jgi:hypothetical protein
MGHLSKLALAQVQKPSVSDPIAIKRNRIFAALVEQRSVLVAKLEGKEHEVTTKRWRTISDGKREQFDTVKRVRAWFFELDGGWYVQCKLGSRALVLDGKNNAVFCDHLKDLDAVFDAFEAALKAKELDQAIIKQSARKFAEKVKDSAS